MLTGEYCKYFVCFTDWDPMGFITIKPPPPIWGENVLVHFFQPSNKQIHEIQVRFHPSDLKKFASLLTSLPETDVFALENQLLEYEFPWQRFGSPGIFMVFSDPKGGGAIWNPSRSNPQNHMVVENALISSS